MIKNLWDIFIFTSPLLSSYNDMIDINTRQERMALCMAAVFSHWLISITNAEGDLLSTVLLSFFILGNS